MSTAGKKTISIKTGIHNELVKIKGAKMQANPQIDVSIGDVIQDLLDFYNNNPKTNQHSIPA